MGELPQLAVVGALPALREALGSRARAVLSAPPGSGKTTLVPLGLVDEPWLAARRILVLEPRRLATRAAARRMAELLGDAVGGTVGYAMRFERYSSQRTRIEVVTEGVFLRRIQADPGLDGVGLVIFDELHERSLDTDLGLALARAVQASLRVDLRLLAMSATMDAEGIAGFLGDAPVIRAAGRPYEVTVDYRPQGPVSAVVEEALARHAGDILVFLEGAGAIDRLAADLADLPVRVCKLHGSLASDAQDAALQPGDGMRKVVLATNIAETSLTIEGIEVVIDTGLARRNRYSARTGMSRLETVRISRASAEQRAGRAGRLGPGHCYRLWPEAETRGLAFADPPEILEADLASLVLELALWGVSDPAALAFLTPPPDGPFNAARRLLQALGALDEAGLVTAHGRDMARLPLHPRLAHMVLEARRHRALATALALAAFAGLRDPWPQAGPDLARRLALWPSAPGELAKVHAQLCRLVGARPQPPKPAMAGVCAALAFPDRIGQRRSAGAAALRLANGRGARLVDAGDFDSAAFVVVWESDDVGPDARVTLAAGIDAESLEAVAGQHIRSTRELHFDPSRRRVAARSSRVLGALVLEHRPVQPSPEAALACLLEGVRRHGLALLPWRGEPALLRQRLAFLHSREPDAWPAVDDETLLTELESWLAPWLAGASSLETLGSDALCRALQARLDPARQRDLERLAPCWWTTPLGTRLAIDYGQDPPVLACRLQELLGQSHHPTIRNGREPLCLHLLSPAGRPIQVTSDLEAFWRGSYAQVRKALRGRYPKHPWPEDPLKATPWRPGHKRDAPAR